jgi:anti-sigma factor RsiW
MKISEGVFRDSCVCSFGGEFAMRCDRAQALMDRYVNEGLPAREREPFEIHLHDCRVCQQQLENLQALVAVLRSDPSPPVPQGFVGRVMARAKEREAIVARTRPVSTEASRSMWKRFESLAGIAAALAAGLMVGVFMGDEAWRADRQQGIASATRPADPRVASGFEYLVNPGGDSLAQAYLGLTATSDR